MKSQRLISLCSAGLASVLLVTMSAVAAAQRPSGAGAPTSRPQPAPQAAPPATQRPEGRPSSPPRGEVKSFTGVAGRLGTTAQALEDAYQAALQTNSKLTRGQFIAANILARNLSGKNAGITTQAILDGLASGKNIGQTLQGLGLSADAAQSAEAQANREARGESQGGKPQQ